MRWTSSYFIPLILLSVAPAGAQVSPSDSLSLDESKIRAVLREGATVVLLPVVNSTNRAIQANVGLAWLGPDEREPEMTSREVTVAPGTSTLEVPFPLTKASIWTRLRYRLTPIGADFRASRRHGGIVALPQIAEHVFEVKSSYEARPRPGRPLVIVAEAVHPLSHAQMKDATWKATLSGKGDALLAPRSTKLNGNFAEFTFDLPVDQGEVLVEVSAQQGDFLQDVRTKIEVTSQIAAQVQSDKSIYQPGQVMHLRAVVLNPEGRAAVAAPVTLRIHDGDEQRVHTVKRVTSQFGVIQDDWQLPESASLGEYNITILTESDEDEIGRHVVRVSRYELPTFSVTVKPDRASYLPSQRASVSISGTYLFGKPVRRGKVRVIQQDEPVWYSRRKVEPSEDVVAEGTAGDDGVLIAQLNLREEQEQLAANQGIRFKDLHFAAYYKDVTSGRTEQRRFDLRITREALHVSLILGAEGGSLRSPAYVVTSTADGTPMAATVTLSDCGQTMSLRTNRLGVGKVLLMGESNCGARRGRRIGLSAVDAKGERGEWLQDYWMPGSGTLRLEASRTLHREGEAVGLKITSPAESPANQTLMVHAFSENHRLASRVVQIANHQSEVAFPYQLEFSGTVMFAIWNENGIPSVKSVIFPSRSELKVSTVTGQNAYRPGEKATLRMQVTSADDTPVAAALGLAIVDQAVMERARTDVEFGHRPWFSCVFCSSKGEAEIGGVRLSDLYVLKPGAALPAELDLVAEALVSQASVVFGSDSSEQMLERPEFGKVVSQMNRIAQDLDQHYASTLEFPEESEGLARILHRWWMDLEDPWGSPYTTEFLVEGPNRVVRLTSAGPDKKSGTEDDFVARSFRRPYFKPLERTIHEILRQTEDYPATDDDFAQLLRDQGLLISALRDPWGTAYRGEAETLGPRRHLRIVSAGPDRKFKTDDDFVLAHFTGSYFSHETRAITAALGEARPETMEEFRALLKRAGTDPDGYRDAWGRPYRLTRVVAPRYGDRVSTKTLRIFGDTTSRTKTEVTPVTQTYVTFALRSDGRDGARGTYDDFDVIRIPILQKEESAAGGSVAPQPAAMLRGTGSIAGMVTDANGGRIANASVTLIDVQLAAYETVSDSEGLFVFPSIPPGIYGLRVFVPGFQQFQMSAIPVIAQKSTRVEAELAVGTVMDAVTVEAEPSLLMTEMASLQSGTSSGLPATTPRVRDYFPETLFWLPEIVTDSGGRASVDVPLADSVTTWKVALFASTLDGRSAEAEGEIRAFQPFFLDLQPPPVLTQGDRVEIPVAVRNYQARAETVSVSLQPNQWSAVAGPAVRKVTVPSNESVNVTYAVEAKAATVQARLRVTAKGAREADAIEKPLRVHPDGQESMQVFADLASETAEFAVSIPVAAISGATRGELRLYPNLGALLLESAREILQVPHGCAEQTISAGYGNLVAWHFARSAGITDQRIGKEALANVRLTLESLSGLRTGAGGIPYWAGDSPDPAVTAYALSFLIDASADLAVDLGEWTPLVRWLEKAQGQDGRWQSDRGPNGERSTLLLTSLVVRGLAAARKAGMTVSSEVMSAAYRHLALFTDQTDEPYLLATLGLAALDSGDELLLPDAVPRLAALAREEKGGRYWDLRTNTPFYGWGVAGRYETTGLVVSALSRWRASHPEEKALDAPIRLGTVFLLRGRKGGAGWYSPQATVRAIRALSDASAALGLFSGSSGSVEIRANGRLVHSVALPADPLATDPVFVDLSRFLPAGKNRISVTPSAGTGSTLLALTVSHWVPWEKALVRAAPGLRWSVAFDRLNAPLGEAVKCRVQAERVGFRGYGMLLAEVGLPPGAEVDRASLESALESGNQALRRYELLPDRVVLYLWPQAGGSTVDFTLSTRLPMAAKSAASLLYDYYNPDELTEIQPFDWRVK